MVALVENIANRTQKARAGADESSGAVDLISLRDELLPLLTGGIQANEFGAMSRGDKAGWISKLAMLELNNKNVTLNTLQERNLITALLQAVVDHFKRETEMAFSESPSIVAQAVETPVEMDFSTPVVEIAEPSVPLFEDTVEVTPVSSKNQDRIEEAAEQIRPILLERMDVSAAAKLERSVLATQITDLVKDVLREENCN